jgi:signal transduction histidine kinase
VSIRIRVAAVFALALAIVLAAFSWLFFAELSAVLLRSVDNGLAVELSQTHSYVFAAGRGAAPATGEYAVQVIDSTGKVRLASEDAGRVALLTPAQLRQARAGPLNFTAPLDGENSRFAAEPYARRGWVAVAVVGLESYDSTRAIMATGLAVGGIVVLALAGSGAYLLTGAALSPVERLRKQAAALSSQDAGAGLAVPATRDEVAALATTMNELLGRLHTALTRQRQFVADASHELRTPLAVLCGELELAARPGRSLADLTAAVASAADEASRLRRLTNDMLLLARSDEGMLLLEPGTVSIRDLIERSARRARASADTAAVTLALDVPEGLVGYLDADRIQQAVDNLLDNALRFAPAGSQITISAQPDEADIELSVSDAGPGFPVDFLSHAFDRFSRPGGGRSRSDGGAGLGLAIVSAIASAHGGSARAANNATGGAVVTMRIPRSVGLPEGDRGSARPSG